MKTNLLHPLATHTPRALDVIFGGNERDTIDESAKLAYDSVKYLPKEQHVLYVNTLCDQRSMEKTMHKFASRRPRLLYMTWFEKSFMERLEALESIIKAKDVGVLVINSFEFAALTQRHRVELGQWIRRVRNMFQIRVVVFMQCKPGYYGVNGSLRFAANNLMEVGEYRKEHAAEFTSHRFTREEAIAEDFAKENEIIVETDETDEVEVEVEVEREVGAAIDEEEVFTGFGESLDDEEESIDEEDSWLDPAQRLLLKHKELEVAGVA